jgi:hypothetical protein
MVLERRETGMCEIVPCSRGNHYHLADRRGGNVAPPCDTSVGAASDAGGATAVQPQRRRTLSKRDRHLQRKIEEGRCSPDELRAAMDDPHLPLQVHRLASDWLKVVDREAHGG